MDKVNENEKDKQVVIHNQEFIKKVIAAYKKVKRIVAAGKK